MLVFVPWGELTEVWQHNTREYNCKAVVISCYLPLILLLMCCFSSLTSFVMTWWKWQLKRSNRAKQAITTFMFSVLFHQNFYYVHVRSSYSSFCLLKLKCAFTNKCSGMFIFWVTFDKLKLMSWINCAEVDVWVIREKSLFIFLNLILYNTFKVGQTSQSKR